MRVLAWPAFSNASYNPYTLLLYRELESLGVSVVEFSPNALLHEHYDIWHMHWPENVLTSRNPLKVVARVVKLFYWIYVARRNGAKVVWTAHNTGSHERRQPFLEPIFWALFTRQLNGWFTLSQTGEAAIKAKHPFLRRVPSFLTLHGHYRDVYPNSTSRSEARKKLNLGEDLKVLSFIGRIRSYKNVPGLIRTFVHLQGDDLILLVAGKPETLELENEIRALAASDGRVKLFLDMIPAYQMQFYLAAADLVTLPYREFLNSGSALLALSFNTPVLVPARGAMEELQSYAGSQWVKTYGGTLSPKILEEAIAWSMSKRCSTLDLSELEWSSIAERTLGAYREVLGMRAGI